MYDLVKLENNDIVFTSGQIMCIRLFKSDCFKIKIEYKDKRYLILDYKKKEERDRDYKAFIDWLDVTEIESEEPTEEEQKIDKLKLEIQELEEEKDSLENVLKKIKEELKQKAKHGLSIKEFFGEGELSLITETGE